LRLSILWTSAHQQTREMLPSWDSGGAFRRQEKGFLRFTSIVKDGGIVGGKTISLFSFPANFEMNDLGTIVFAAGFPEPGPSWGRGALLNRP